MVVDDEDCGHARMVAQAFRSGSTASHTLAGGYQAGSAGQSPRRSSIASSRRHRGRTLTCSSRNTFRPRRASISGRARSPIAEGEIETLYVLDDWRDQGLGRRLLTAAGGWLHSRGCASAFLWVLRDNPSRWFYERLGGRPAANAHAAVAGQRIPQVAYAWDPIGRLLAASPQQKS